MAPYLNSKYDNSSISDHVEEERHGLVLMRGVGVKDSLRHHAASRLVKHHHVYASSFVLLSILQDLASYTNIKFLSSQLKLFLILLYSSNTFFFLNENFFRRAEQTFCGH